MLNLSNDAKARLNDHRLIQWIIWITINTSVAILIFIAHRAQTGSIGNSVEDIDRQQQIFGIISFGLLMASLIISFKAKSESRIRNSLNKLLPANRENSDLAAKFSEGETHLFVAVADAFALFVIALAVSEAAALQGFVLAYSAQNPDLIYPFVAGTFVINLFNLPNADRVANIAGRLRPPS